MSSPAEELEVGPGRPTDYTEEYCHIAHQMYSAGATVFELGERLGVTARTIYRWQAEHPEFKQSLKLGRDAADQRVEDSLFHRAVGYNFPAVKIFKSKGEDPVVVPYIEHAPPDVGAAALWLTNRRSKDWKQTKTLEVKDGRGDLEVIDAILARFNALKSGMVVEGEVVPAAGAQNDAGTDAPGLPRLPSKANGK